MTRMLSYNEMTKAVDKIVSHFNWEIFGFFFHNYKEETKGYSSCHHILAPIHRAHNNGSNYRETFDIETSYEMLKMQLDRLKEKSRSKLEDFQFYFSLQRFNVKQGTFNYFSCIIYSLLLS